MSARRFHAACSLALALGALAACGPEAPPASPTNAPPDVAPAPSPAGTSRAALSQTLRDALDRGDLGAARAAWAGLEAHHDGVGERPDGKVLSPAAMRGALFDVALAGARSRVEGTAPDPTAAQAALAIAEELAPSLAEDGAAQALAGARRYVSLARLADLATPLAEHAGPRVVVACDDFDLAEPGVLATLERWAQEGREAALRVSVLPLRHGYVRVGNRRVRAQDREEERRALEKRLTGRGVAQEPEPASVAGVLADLGLEGKDMAVFVFDREGRLVARLAGRALDLQPLEVAVQRVGSR